MEKISVVINTLNEEKNLPRALTSVKKIADEVIVVDMRSDDRTVEIATRFGAKVFGHDRTGYVEPARNFAISKATGDWILILDADEELTLSLRKKLRKIVRSDDKDYYRIPRKNLIFGKWLKHSRWWPDYNIRFFKKGSVTWNELIHSVPLTSGEGADIKDVEEYAIIHHHYESIEQFITRLNKYTSEHSKGLVANGYKFKWSDLIIKPNQEFLSRYFYGQGFKDGIHGLALAGLQAFSEFVLYLKTWQIEKFSTKDRSAAGGKDEISVYEVITVINKAIKEISYWTNDTLFKETGKYIYKIKRKLKLS